MMADEYGEIVAMRGMLDRAGERLQDAATTVVRLNERLRWAQGQLEAIERAESLDDARALARRASAQLASVLPCGCVESGGRG